MKRILEETKAWEYLVSKEDFVLFRDLKEKSFPDADSEWGKVILREAEKSLKKDIPVIRISAYLRFTKPEDGERMEWQNLYYERRIALRTLLAASLVAGSSRYINKIMDLVWAILEETTWTPPAHNPDVWTYNVPMGWRDEIRYTEMIAAETAAYMACVYYFLKQDMIDAGGQLILERIQYEVNRQVLAPFLQYDAGWMLGGGNWSAWAISHIFTCAALLVEDEEQKKEIVRKGCRLLDIYWEKIPEDGGCDEGAVYWFNSGGCFFNSLETLYDMTGGRVNLFAQKEVQSWLTYICKVHIADNQFVSYSDATPENNSLSGTLIRRMGRRMDNPVMEGFGQRLLENKTEAEGAVTARYHVLQFIKSLVDQENAKEGYRPERFYLFEDLQLCVMREKREEKDGFCVWLKGGHNQEAHNHNDVGSVGVYYNGAPVWIDFGAGTYTRAYFGPERFSLFAMNSKDHNLPLIGGSQQMKGREYKTGFFMADKETMTARTALADAYANKDSIRSFVRTLCIKDGEVILLDEINLKEAQEVEFRFHMKEQPIIAGEGKVILNQELELVYDASLSTEIEKIVPEDTRYQSGWKTEAFYRLILKTDGKVEDVRSEVRVRRRQ